MSREKGKQSKRDEHEGGKVRQRMMEEKWGCGDERKRGCTG